jgi:hypothetical protein
MTELELMYGARIKLNKVIQLQEKLDLGLIDVDAVTYSLTQQQKDDRIAAINTEKTALITELVTMMNAYLEQ